jgi:hypothetical protein
MKKEIISICKNYFFYKKKYVSILISDKFKIFFLIGDFPLKKNKKWDKFYDSRLFIRL